MMRGEDIPIDLIIEILLRLPINSIARCRFVSKQWRSILLDPYFNELFLNRSSTRPPSLLFAVKQSNDDWSLLTAPQPQNLYEKPLSITADFHMKFPVSDRTLEFRGHASGFIHFFHDIRENTRQGDEDTVRELVICNPTTGQHESVALFKRTNYTSFLGFDPIDKQFKVLSCSSTYKQQGGDKAYILTLGTRNESWRMIHCPKQHSPRGEGICINGVLYYFGFHDGIVCFDVRYEKFKFIRNRFSYCSRAKLINYKGKLGVITLTEPHISGPPKLCMSVAKDVEDLDQSKWSEYFSLRLDDEVVQNHNVSIAGITATGVIVLSTRDASKPFYVIYIDPERNTIQKFEVQGLRPNHNCDNRGQMEYSRVQVFVDYVEDLNVINMMKKTSSSSKRESATISCKAYRLQQDGRTKFASTNKFDYLRLLDDGNDDDDETKVEPKHRPLPDCTEKVQKDVTPI